VQAPSSSSVYVASLPISPLPIGLQAPASASLILDFPQLDLLPIIPLEPLRIVLRITADYLLSVRARKMRWTEEVDLLLEEMRHVDQFLEWHGGWWMERANQRKSVDKGIQEGLSAYTHRQASIHDHLKEKFEEL